MNKKYIIITVISILILSIGASLAYWTATLRGEGTPMSFSSGEARIIFDKKEDGSITSDAPIEPGWSMTKTFSVQSESDTTYKYNIILKDCINTFKTTGFLVYKITSTNGYNMTDYQDIPKSEITSNVILAEEISIDPDETHEYTIELKYIETDEDQSPDMGATLSGTLFIKEYKPKVNLYTLLSNESKYTLGDRGTFDTVFGGETITQGYNQTGTIYRTEDNNDYYFAGNPSDNWVYFAGFWWRIIRTNSTEGTRLLYAGTSHDGQDGYINDTTYVWNSDSSNYEHVYWSNANFLDTLNTWYSSNITGTNDSMVNSVTYCNDTSYIDMSSSWGTNGRKFGAYTRLIDSKVPAHTCGTNQFGNAAKVGLNTSDEIAFAGGLYANNAPNTYYYRNSKSECKFGSNDSCSVTGNQGWWTMSPSSFANAGVFIVNGAGDYPGALGVDRIHNSFVVRPVITLLSTVKVSGSGTTDDPYIPSL